MSGRPGSRSPTALSGSAHDASLRLQRKRTYNQVWERVDEFTNWQQLDATCAPFRLHPHCACPWLVAAPELAQGEEPDLGNRFREFLWQTSRPQRADASAAAPVHHSRLNGASQPLPIPGGTFALEFNPP